MNPSFSNTLKAMAVAVLCAAAVVVQAHVAHEGWHGSPTLTIIAPQQGQSFLQGDNVTIDTLAENFTDAVASVEFFEGTNSLAVVTNNGWSGYDSDRFSRGNNSSFTWSNAPVGDYVLSAMATDMAGNSVTSAPVDISVVTNIPPVISLVKPHNNAVILGPTNITLYAWAYDPQGAVTQVEFFEGTNSLGVVPTPPVIYVTNWWGVHAIYSSSYSLTWSNVTVGDYTLTAVATDNGGVSTTSSVVNISVVSNLPPAVVIVQPYNGKNYTAPASISIGAWSADSNGGVTNVEFYAGSQDLGPGTPGFSETNHNGEILTWSTLTWSSVAAGSYALTAVAADGAGLSTTSAPVNVTVSAPPPPQVKITWPFNGATFTAPANINIFATTEFFGNTVTQVQFLNGSNVLGVVNNPSWPISLLWTNVPVGSYTLTAIGTDASGVSATSAPVTVQVVTNQFRWWNPW